MPEKILNMRSERQMYDLILGFAKTDERVRGVILNGGPIPMLPGINIRIMI